jgi:hypothetical protein
MIGHLPDSVAVAEQWDILELFEKGDPYSTLASKFFGRPIFRKTVPEDALPGHVGKVGELGLGFGMGAPKLRNTLKVGALGGEPVIITEETSVEWVGVYRGSHQMVVKYWGQSDTALQLLDDRQAAYPWGPMWIDKGYIHLPNDTRLDYTGLVREEGEWRMRNRAGQLMRNASGQPIRLYGGLMTENVVQALARVIMSQAMPIIAERYPIAMSTHDELACIAREDEADECLKFMIEVMTRRPSWLPRIPLAAEGGYDVCYSK